MVIGYFVDVGRPTEDEHSGGSGGQSEDTLLVTAKNIP